MDPRQYVETLLRGGGEGFDPHSNPSALQHVLDTIRTLYLTGIQSDEYLGRGNDSLDPFGPNYDPHKKVQHIKEQEDKLQPWHTIANEILSVLNPDTGGTAIVQPLTGRSASKNGIHSLDGWIGGLYGEDGIAQQNTYSGRPLTYKEDEFIDPNTVNELLQNRFNEIANGGSLNIPPDEIDALAGNDALNEQTIGNMRGEGDLMSQYGLDERYRRSTMTNENKTAFEERHEVLKPLHSSMRLFKAMRDSDYFPNLIEEMPESSAKVLVVFSDERMEKALTPNNIEPELRAELDEFDNELFEYLTKSGLDYSLSFATTDEEKQRVLNEYPLFLKDLYNGNDPLDRYGNSPNQIIKSIVNNTIYSLAKNDNINVEAEDMEFVEATVLGVLGGNNYTKSMLATNDRLLQIAVQNADKIAEDSRKAIAAYYGEYESEMSKSANRPNDLTYDRLHIEAHRVDDNYVLGAGDRCFDMQSVRLAKSMGKVQPELEEHLMNYHGINYVPHYHTYEATDPNLYMVKSQTSEDYRFNSMHDEIHRKDHAAYMRGRYQGSNYNKCQTGFESINSGDMDYNGNRIPAELTKHIKSMHGLNYQMHPMALSPIGVSAADMSVVRYNIDNPTTVNYERKGDQLGEGTQIYKGVRSVVSDDFNTEHVSQEDLALAYVINNRLSEVAAYVEKSLNLPGMADQIKRIHSNTPIGQEVVYHQDPTIDNGLKDEMIKAAHQIYTKAPIAGTFPELPNDAKFHAKEDATKK